ncbi:MAG: NADH-quinone oxidoreductase subunit J [Campylobacterales bacterium]|nr:NADH-quinone oxidoreductase subunit J [Campylobacterales bacterium]
MINIVFLALSFGAIAGALAMLLYKNPMYCALGLLISVLSVAGLFALLSATFLFMVQLIVYAGAIMTLVIFILMFLNIKDEDMPDEPNKFKHMIFAAALMLPLNIVILKAVSNLPSSDFSIVAEDFGGIHDVGMYLYTNWLLAFELISILLLVALIGAIVLVKKKKEREVK